MTWTYDEVKRMLNGGRVHVLPGLSQTCFVQGDDGDLHLRYVDTNIVTYHPDATFTLNTDGYTTRTTIRRLREFGPCGVVVRDGEIFLEFDDGEVKFHDGICVDWWGNEMEELDEADRHAIEMTIDNQIRKEYL